MYKMKVAIYIRVSTQEQAMEGYSIGAQEERLRAYCKAKGWIVSDVYCDPGVSGATLERPALNKMIMDIQLKKVDMVLVYKLDRLSRSQKDTLYLIEDVFMKNDIHFVSMNENFDTSTAFGRAMIGILSVFAQLEREQIKERMAMGREARAKDGKWHGSNVTPFGYKYINQKLEVDPFESILVKEIFDRYLTGESACSIARSMYKKCPTQPSLKAANGITDILKRKTYLGIISHGNIDYDGQHDAIITQDVFDKTQSLLETKNTKFRKMDSTSLLTGLIWCKQCGARYAFRNKVDIRWIDGKKIEYRYPQYKCYSRYKVSKTMIRDENCKNKIWKLDELNEIVKNEIFKLCFEDTHQPIEPVNPDDNKKVIETKLHDIDIQIGKLIDLYSLDGIDISVVQSKIKLLNDQKDELQHSLLDEKEIIYKKQEFKSNLEKVHEVFESGTLADQKQLLSALIEKIELDGDSVEIHWNF